MIRDRVLGLFGQEEGPRKQYIWNVHEVRHHYETGDVSVWGQEEKDYGPHKEFKFEGIKTVDILGVNTAKITSVMDYRLRIGERTMSLLAVKIRARAAREQKQRGAVVARFKESESGYRSVLVFYEKVHEELM
jgi:hypothetical protein